MKRPSLPAMHASGSAAASRRSSRRTTLAALSLLGLGSLATTGCKRDYIPNTDVDDTEQNRKVIAFCEKYRHAVERKDVPALLKLASPRYYEDGGNTDASDDLDYAGLRDYLSSRFQDATSIRYEIRYRRVLRRENVIYVDYTFSASYRIPGLEGAPEEWHRKVDDNRLELEVNEDGEPTHIAAGM